MQKVTLIGNIARDIEVHTTQNGVKKVNFSVAVNRRFTNANGTREADFIPVVAWRQTADFAEKWLSKGKKIAAVGELRTRTYEAQDGSKRFIMEVEVEEIELMPSAKADAQKPAGKPQETPKGEMTENSDDELPF